MEPTLRDNITLALSIFGSVSVVATWIVSWIKARKNISLKIIKLSKTRTNMIMFMSVSNRSNMAIAIESISIVDKDAQYTCNQAPDIVLVKSESSGGITTNKREFYSMQFPINLSSLSAASGYIAFDIPQEVSQNLSTPLTVRVLTNRGRAIEMKLECENEVHWAKM